MIKAEKMMPKAANAEAWKEAHPRAQGNHGRARRNRARKSGLSVHGTDVLTNLTNNRGGLPTRNSLLPALPSVRN